MDWDCEFTHHELLRIYLGRSERRGADDYEPAAEADQEQIEPPTWPLVRLSPLIDIISKVMRPLGPSDEPQWTPPQGFHPAQDSRLGHLLAELTSPLLAEHLLTALRKQMTAEIITALKSFPYERFLRTEYWLIVRAYVIQQRSRRCEQCHRTGDLNVHHRTYDHRGEEIFYLEDLCLLCESCHATVHGRSVDS